MAQSSQQADAIEASVGLRLSFNQEASMSNQLVVYQPQGQAGEYAEWATNPYRGCGNGCVYCYVPQVLHMPREEFDAGAVPKSNFLARLDHAVKKLIERGELTTFYEQPGSQVMLSFTTDPYPLPFEGVTTQDDLLLTRRVLEHLHDFGIGFCTLTKGGTRALRDLSEFDRRCDAFACTLTTLDDSKAAKWERFAAPPSDRLKALWEFHDKGIYTWVSLEPTLNVEESLEVIRATAHMVNLYKVGKANYIKTPQPIDWADYTRRVLDVLHEVNAEHYIKRDLQPHLPPGYPNEQHRPQHF
jgi:DNA repair photolyase